jgi:hypothetical protein
MPWLYDHDEPLSRYTLGEKGENPLICVGVNPSTAVPNKLDPTVASVARFSKERDYDGWIMLNLYPQRATNPDKMHKRFQKEIHLKNMHCIEEWVGRYPGSDIWCAWGTLIEKRSYLSHCLHDMHTVFEAHECRYFSRGRLSKAGHPHHPLYLRKDAPMDPFDLNTYMGGLQKS